MQNGQGQSAFIYPFKKSSIPYGSFVTILRTTTLNIRSIYHLKSLLFGGEKNVKLCHHVPYYITMPRVYNNLKPAF